MLDFEALSKEANFKAVRSSGAGGQHVNKISSKVILSFNIDNSSILTEVEKELLIKKLQNRITTQNDLILECSETRSQHQNKELVLKRFKEVILSALKKHKKRKKTKPTKASKFKRLRAKKLHSEKKADRRKPNL